MFHFLQSLILKSRIKIKDVSLYQVEFILGKLVEVT